MENKIIYPSFIMIPHKVLIDKTLEPLDKMVYGVIWWYAKLRGKKCMAFNKTIAEILDKCATSVSHSLTRLEKAKHIKRVFYDKGKKRRNEIIPLTMMDKGLSINKQKREPINGEEWEIIEEIGIEHFGVEPSEFWMNSEMKSYAVKKYKKTINE